MRKPDQEPAQEAPARSPPLVILVVEDDDAVRKMLGTALGSFGFDAKLAASGDAAIKIYQQQPVDLVLLDVRLPILDGPSTLRALQDLDPDVVCVFVSADTGHYTYEELLNFGAVDILPKPFHLEELRRVVLRAASKGE